MTRLNKYYIDTFALKNNILNESIHSGNEFNVSLRYKFDGLFDFGFYGNIQYAQVSGHPIYIETDSVPPYFIDIIKHTGDINFITQAIGIGITNCWYMSHLLKFHKNEHDYIKNLHFAIELNGGIGFSKVILDMKYPTYQFSTFYEYFTSRDFQGHLALKFDYDIMKKPLILSIGLRGGYQYFISKTLKDRFDRDWITLEQYKINLDFVRRSKLSDEGTER